MLELAAGTNAQLLPLPRGLLLWMECACPNGEAPGRAGEGSGQRGVHGGLMGGRANELLLVGRMFPSKLMCANA